MSSYRDPVTRAIIKTTDPLAVPSDLQFTSVQGVADKLYNWLNSLGRGKRGYQPAVPCVLHASDSYVIDHLLLTSALVYCLGYEKLSSEKDNITLHLLRLAAISHEFSDRAMLATQLFEHSDFLEEAWDLLDNQARQLENGFSEDSFALLVDKIPPVDDPWLSTLWYAHLAASDRLFNRTWTSPNEDEAVKSLATREDFYRHPLRTGGEVALVYGGATKIKSYVFESARLPEIRGASSLFDRINILDMPALWGRQPQQEDYPLSGLAGATRRYEQIRSQFVTNNIAERCLLEAPECILYASGGNILALAPPRVAHQLANAIEQLYTQETLVGNSVAVAQTYSLLELQYGRTPQAYWVEQFVQQMTNSDDTVRSLLSSYYSNSIREIDRKNPSHPDHTPLIEIDEYYFVLHKGFGELVTLLASEANRRRAGNETSEKRLHRHIPQYELLPITAKCHSCDLRPATIAIVEDEVEPAIGAPKVFCEACARKRVTGQRAKRNVLSDESSSSQLDANQDPIQRWFSKQFSWSPDGVPSWEELFESFLQQHPQWETTYHEKAAAQDVKPHQIKAAEDIEEIANASKPEGYVGYIYADGNDVGNLVARIRTPGAYRQFGQRLYQANVHAVFTALAQHLQARYQKTSPKPDRRRWRTDIYLHPFEIVTIGGDDLILIVPGHKAVDIAHTIADELEQRVMGPKPKQAKGKQPQDRYTSLPTSSDEAKRWTDETWPTITLSAGIAIAHAHTPILYMSELAEQLQKSAKSARKSGILANYPGGTVDFAALKATGSVSLPWRAYHTHAFAMHSNTRLSMRPYTWHELEGLAETIRDMKQQGYPRSQLYRLQEDLYLGRSAATLNYLYFLVRTRNDAIKESLGKYQLGWLAAYDLPPWRSVPADLIVEKTNDSTTRQVVETIWRDLVELYDFIPLISSRLDARIVAETAPDQRTADEIVGGE